MAKPKLRFPEFTDEWEEKQLKDFMLFKNGLNADKDKFGSGIKFISVMDILNNPFITYDVIRGKVNIDKKTLNNYSVTYGDVLFQRSSETREDAGKSNVYLDKERIATFGGFVIRGKRIGDYSPEFMNSLLKSPKVRKEITSKAQGAQHINVGQETLENVGIILPVIKEQERIAEFLSSIDDIIQVHEEEIFALEEQKKGVMQKLFNREVRFKADDGSEYSEWERKKVKDIFKITRGYVLAVNSTKIRIEDDYQYPVYSSQTKGNGLMGYYNEYLYENAITWTTDGANAGTVVFRKGKFYCTNVCGVLISNNGNANVCMAEIINSISYKYVSYVGNPKLMNNVMAEIKIEVPCLEEQQKISDCLSAYDEAIQIKKDKLEVWKEIKKGLLQQMFV